MNLTLYNKRDFAYLIKNLEIDCPSLFSLWSLNSITVVLIKGKQKEILLQKTEGNVMTSAERRFEMLNCGL